jgi:Na+-translocating ferredoxin:NAD+ oxidoreductase subunit B
MNEDIYLKLCNHLNKYPLWAPATDAFLEILQIMFTPEDAEFALLLSPRLETVSQIAQRTAKDPEYVRNLLEQMVKNGVIHKDFGSPEDKKDDRYGLLPTAAGIWEVTFAKKEKTPRTEKLGRLWRRHYEQGWGQEMGRRIKKPAMRVLPIGQSIGGEAEVLPYEKASEFLKTAEYCAVCDCACRSASELAGEGCGKPTDVCLMFGDFAKFLVDTGRARKVDHEGAMEVLKRSEEAGLVHLTMNTSDMVVSICSCCACCCTQLRAISYLPKPNAIAKSRFIASLNPELCTSCGVCEERCQVKAISLGEETAELIEERCIGCGLCVTTCPTEAITLIERTDYEKPIPTVRELILGMKDSANKPANQ